MGKIAVAELKARGHEVVRFDIRTNRLDMHSADDRDQALEGCDVVVHLAAIPHPAARHKWPDYWRENCQGVARMAQSALEHHVTRFIFTSSTAYYGFERGIPYRAPVDEDSPYAALYLVAADLERVPAERVYYMQSKVIAENILAAYGLTKQMQVAILRLSPMREDGNHPYCGLWMGDLTRAGRAIADLVDDPGELWYEVFNLADPECEVLDTTKIERRSE